MKKTPIVAEAFRAAGLPLTALIAFKHSPYIYKTTIHVYQKRKCCTIALPALLHFSTAIV